MDFKILGHVIFIQKKYLFAGIVILLFAGVTAGYFMMNKEIRSGIVLNTDTPYGAGNISTTVPSSGYSETEGNIEKIYVYIVGEVKHPGLYHLSKGALVYDVISEAGGVTEAADAGNINMAQELESNIMIRVLSEEERVAQNKDNSLVFIKDEEEDNSPDEEKSSESGKININKADKSKLMELPGIGEKRAQDIINYRETTGPFKKIEDIMNVTGIKEALYNSIKDLIAV